MNLRIYFPYLLITGSFLFGCAVASGQNYRPNQNVVGSNARHLSGYASSIQGTLHRQFRQSRVYGQLRGKMNQVRMRALQLQTLSRINASQQQIYNQTDQIYRLMEDFQVLVSTARYRSAYGLDRPLCGCTLHLDRTMNAMYDSITCVYDELNAQSRFNNFQRSQFQQVQGFGQTDYRYNNRSLNGFRSQSFRYANGHRSRNQSFYKR